MQNHLNVQDGRYPQSERRPGHEVGNYTLVGFAFINLSELLFAIELNANPILKNVLYVLLLRDRGPVFVLCRYDFLKIGRVGPGNLDCSGCLGYMREDSHGEGVVINLLQVSLQQVFVEIKAILDLFEFIEGRETRRSGRSALICC